MLQNYGRQQIKNILFLLWKCLHVKRRGWGGGTREGEAAKERERKRERREKCNQVSPNTDNKNLKKRTEEGVKMIQFGFENLILLVFKSLPDAV